MCPQYFSKISIFNLYQKKIHEDFLKHIFHLSVTHLIPIIPTLTLIFCQHLFPLETPCPKSTCVIITLSLLILASSPKFPYFPVFDTPSPPTLPKNSNSSEFHSKLFHSLVPPSHASKTGSLTSPPLYNYNKSTPPRMRPKTICPLGETPGDIITFLRHRGKTNKIYTKHTFIYKS